MKGKKSKIWFETTCQIHGKTEAKDKTGTPRVTVSPPNNTREAMSGCPICKSER